MRRIFVHLPRFPVQRRVMQTPSLAQKPLVLVENMKGHLRVVFASTAAFRALFARNYEFGDSRCARSCREWMPSFARAGSFTKARPSP